MPKIDATLDLQQSLQYCLFPYCYANISTQSFFSSKHPPPNHGVLVSCLTVRSVSLFFNVSSVVVLILHSAFTPDFVNYLDRISTKTLTARVIVHQKAVKTPTPNKTWHEQTCVRDCANIKRQCTERNRFASYIHKYMHKMIACWKFNWTKQSHAIIKKSIKLKLSIREKSRRWNIFSLSIYFAIRKIDCSCRSARRWWWWWSQRASGKIYFNQDILKLPFNNQCLAKWKNNKYQFSIKTI